MSIETLDPSRAALLVIDMQNAFGHAEGTLGISGVDIEPARATIAPSTATQTGVSPSSANASMRTSGACSSAPVLRATKVGAPTTTRCPATLPSMPPPTVWMTSTASSTSTTGHACCTAMAMG